jgi:DNA-binding SARP family transcriptional activator
LKHHSIVHQERWNSVRVQLSESRSSITKRLNVVVSNRAGLALGIWGEPGVGKTFTVQAVLREMPCRSLNLHATVSGATLLRALVRPKHLPDWAARQIELLERGDHLESKALADLLAAWLAALAPFVLCIEDLHEVAPDRLELWTTLAVAVGRTRGVGLIVTGRTPPPSPFMPLHLEPLPVQEARGLLEAESGSPLPPEAITWIETHARGNPLFTLEYFRHLTRMGFLWSDGRRWRWREPDGESMPNNVEAVIGHHLRAVWQDAQTRVALAVKAMLPFEASDQLWLNVSGLEKNALRAIQDGLERSGIFKAGQFVHPLFREAMRANVLPQERQAIARKAITVLQERDPITAADFLDDANLNVEDTHDLLARASSAARESGDVRLTARLLMRLAEFKPQAERLQTMLEAARLLQRTNPNEALQMAQLALRLDARHLEAILLTAELLASVSRGDEAERLLEHLLAQHVQLPGDAGSSENAERIFETRIRVKHLHHDDAGVLKLWHEQTAQDPDERPKIGMAVIARAYLQCWRLEEAESVIAQALRTDQISNLQQAELRYIRAIIPYYSGQYANAEIGFTALLETLEILDDGSSRFQEMRAGTYQLRAYMRNVLGRPQGALEDITEALAVSANLGNAGYYAHVQSELGLYLLETGDYPRAEDTLLEARATLERVGNALYLSVLERICARLYLEWAPPHGSALSLKHARAALQHIEVLGRPAMYADGALFIAAWAEAVHGRADEALALSAELEALAQHLGQVAVTTGAAWVRGLALERLGHNTEARNALQTALNTAIPMQLGPTLERMALELDRLNNDAISAQQRSERFRINGADGALHVAQRYFPQLQQDHHGQHDHLDPGHDQHGHRTITPNVVLLEVLGPTQVTADGVSLSYRTRKGKEFLAMLCEARLAGRPEVSDLNVFESLYPELNEDHAGSALKQLVYRLRNALGGSTVLRSNNGYMLGAVETDAEQFLRSHDTRLWRGPYMSDLGEDWPSSARDALHFELRKRALELLPEHPAETARLGCILLEVNPYDAEVLRWTMQAFRDGGNNAEANRLLASAKQHFAELGERLPKAV